MWTLSGAGLVLGVGGLLATRYRYTVPALAAVAVALWTGRFGFGLGPSRVAFGGPVLDLTTAAGLLVAPLATYLVCAVAIALVVDPSMQAEHG